jgi:hypothetical protein
VDRTYGIIEIVAGDSPTWLRAVSGHEAAVARLKDIAAKTKNEVRPIHVPSLSIIAVMNETKTPAGRPMTDSRS